MAVDDEASASDANSKDAAGFSKCPYPTATFRLHQYPHNIVPQVKPKISTFVSKISKAEGLLPYNGKEAYE